LQGELCCGLLANLSASKRFNAGLFGATGTEAEENTIRANYGYADATGEYYLTIDTARCDGCGDCVPACPENILEIVRDDFGELKAAVRDDVAQLLAHACLGYDAYCVRNEVNCHSACHADAIQHTW
jgi:ferredoxin